MLEVLEMTSWAVKDVDGAVAIVTANKFEIDAHGLMFLIDGRKVALFVRWAAFWETSTALYLPAVLTERKT